MINWGDGSPNTTFSLAAGAFSFSGQTHQYKDDNPTNTSSDVYTVTVTVTDNDGASGSGTHERHRQQRGAVGDDHGAGERCGLRGQHSGHVHRHVQRPGHAGHAQLLLHDHAGQCTYWQFDAIKKAATVVESNGSGTANTTYTFTTPGVYNVSLYVP